MKESKFKVVYSDKGIAYSDFNVVNCVQSSINDFYEEYSSLCEYDINYEVTTSTENYLIALRLAVANSEISYKDVVIEYDKQEYYLDKYGAYINIAEFENTQQNLLDKILKANFEMVEKEG